MLNVFLSNIKKWPEKYSNDQIKNFDNSVKWQKWNFEKNAFFCIYSLGYHTLSFGLGKSLQSTGLFLSF